MAKPSLPQFEPDYDFYKMRTLVDELNRWVETVESGESGAGGATGDHNLLTGRSAADAHPTSAITGLDATLAVFAGHIADSSIHFTEASIDHANIQNIGSNSHAAIDTHIASSANPHGVTLQQAYNAAVAAPQITINATPDPLTIDASVVGDVFAVRDTTGQDLIRMATTGSSIAGGSNAGNILTLEGALAATADTGIVQINSPVTFAYDTVSNTTPAQPFLMQWGPAIATGAGAYIGGCLQTEAVFAVTTGVFIPAIFSDTNRYNIGAVPGFSAITFINELSVVANDGNFNLPSALVMNIGLTHERNTSGTSTTPGTTGVSFSPQTRTTVAGAIMTKTDQTAVRCSVTFSTVFLSAVNLGTIRGLHVFNPAVALFQPAAGVENATAIIGVDINNLTFGGNITKAALRSAHVSTGSNSYFLLNTGTAVSDFGSSNIHFNDLFGVSFGTPLSAPDLNIGVLAGGVFFLNWTTGDTGQLRMSSELQSTTTDRFLWTSTVSAEYNFDCDRFSLGAQTGAVGNQVGVFVAPTRSVAIGGGWSDFLLTQAGSITLNAAMSQVFGWTINAPSITLGTGSVVDAGGLLVGGNVNQGTNRYGVLILSGPSGGTLNYALRCLNGDARFDARVDIDNPIALGGGAVATLGTIGATGPTAAAQAQWVEIDIGGVAHWVPVWV